MEINMMTLLTHKSSEIIIKKERERQNFSLIQSIIGTHRIDHFITIEK
jgi:hypothetical protein